jgi:hypothetical protein
MDLTPSVLDFAVFLVGWQEEQTLDQLGNWAQYKYGPALDWLNQTHTHNAVNETTRIGAKGNWGHPAFSRVAAEMAPANSMHHQQGA